MAHKGTKMNKKVLSSMSEAAMPSPAPRIMMHLHGKDAKRFMNKKPGSKISAQIRGTLQSVGLDEWNHNEPRVEIKVTKICPSQAKKA